MSEEKEVRFVCKANLDNGSVWTSAPSVLISDAMNVLEGFLYEKKYFPFPFPKSCIKNVGVYAITYHFKNGRIVRVTEDTACCYEIDAK